jgi:serine/threonine protein kinase
VVGAALLAFYFKVKNSENDSVWKVKKEELIFPDPPQVIGSGTFGLVLLAEYRGTQVAVKRVLPPKTTDARSLGKRSTISGSSIEGSYNTNDSSDENSPCEGKRLGTTSWGGMNISGVGGLGMLSQQHATQSRLGGRSGLKSGTKTDFSSKKQYKGLKEDFIKEMRYLSKLRHPCITTVMGAVIPKDNESPSLVMEYMDHVSVAPELAYPFNGRLHTISALSHNSILFNLFLSTGFLT